MIHIFEVFLNRDLLNRPCDSVFMKFLKDLRLLIEFTLYWSFFFSFFFPKKIKKLKLKLRL